MGGEGGRNEKDKKVCNRLFVFNSMEKDEN